MFASMMLRRATLGATLLFVTAALASCGKSTTAPPTPISQADATSAAEQVGMLVTFGSAPNLVPDFAGMSQDPIHLGRAKRARFSAAFDTTFSDSNFTWSFSANWFDAAGNTMPEFDPMATVQLVADSRLSGGIVSANGSLTLGATGHWDTRGLSNAQDTLTTDATRADTLHWDYQGPNGAARFDSRATGAFVRVRQLKPVNDGTYPISGQAAWTLAVSKQFTTPNGERTGRFNASAVITFNGTRYVPLVINDRWTYTLDLDTGAVTPVPA